jgi:hypothetical protein
MHLLFLLLSLAVVVVVKQALLLKEDKAVMVVDTLLPHLTPLCYLLLFQ